MRVKVEKLRIALVEAGRNDLAEQLNTKYKEVHGETEKKIKGDVLKHSVKSSSRIFTFYVTLRWRHSLKTALTMTTHRRNINKG